VSHSDVDGERSTRLIHTSKAITRDALGLIVERANDKTLWDFCERG